MILLIFIYVCVALVDVPSLIRERKWKFLSVYAAIFFTAITLSILYRQSIRVPSPLTAIYQFIQNYMGLGYTPEQ